MIFIVCCNWNELYSLNLDFFVNFLKSKRRKNEKCLKITLTTLFYHIKLFSQKFNAELAKKLAKVLIIIDSLRFHFKVDMRVAFKKNENIPEFSQFGYFLGLLVEIFYIPLVDYMYDLMCNIFFAKHLHISWV